MKPIHIEATTISDAWFRLINELAPEDNEHELYYRQGIQRGSFENEQHRRQFAGASVYIEHPDQDIVPYISPAYGIPAPTTMEYIEGYWATYIMSSELEEDETYTYGARINAKMPRGKGDIYDIGHLYDKDLGPKNEHDFEPKMKKIADLCGLKKGTQLERIVDMLKETPLTNHAVIEIATPWDLDICWGKDNKNDPPCLRLIDFKVIPKCHYKEGQECEADDCSSCDERELVLSVSVYFRSWDLWAGFPSNLGAIELLKKYVADECGLANGPMYAYSAGLHIYGYQEEMTAIRTGKQ